MTFLRTIGLGEADGDVAAMYLRQQDAWGYVPNYARAFCYRPEVMARWGRLLAEIRRPMNARRFELVTFVAALELRNSACALAHGCKLREYLRDEDIAALASGRDVPALTAGERAMVQFVRRVASDASSVTQADIDGLLTLGFNDAEVFDVAAVAAGRAFFATLLDALGVAPDSPSLALDAGLRELLTVGRPIDRQPTARMAASGSGPASTPACPATTAASPCS